MVSITQQNNEDNPVETWHKVPLHGDLTDNGDWNFQFHSAAVNERNITLFNEDGTEALCLWLESKFEGTPQGVRFLQSVVNAMEGTDSLDTEVEDDRRLLMEFLREGGVLTASGVITKKGQPYTRVVYAPVINGGEA